MRFFFWIRTTFHSGRFSMNTCIKNQMQTRLWERSCKMDASGWRYRAPSPVCNGRWRIIILVGLLVFLWGMGGVNIFKTSAYFEGFFSCTFQALQCEKFWQKRTPMWPPFFAPVFHFTLPPLFHSTLMRWPNSRLRGRPFDSRNAWSLISFRIMDILGSILGKGSRFALPFFGVILGPPSALAFPSFSICTGNRFQQNSVSFVFISLEI